MKSEYRLGRVWGIPINIHISLLILLGWLVLQAFREGGGLLTVLINAAITLLLAALFFTSIALHELGHSFIAIKKGCRVYEITLMFMGGAAKMDRMPTRPIDEFLMAIAGPAVSLLIAIVLISASPSLLNSQNQIVASSGELLRFVGRVNAILAAFNLIPAFPMDGGRIFRALLSTRLDRLKATYIASRTGRAIALLFLFIGIFGLNITIWGIPFFPPRNFILIIIAFFVFTTADREYRMVQVEELLKHRQKDREPFFCNQTFTQSHPDSNSVIISPPPYDDGPDIRKELKEDIPENNPFTGFFKL